MASCSTCGLSSGPAGGSCPRCGARLPSERPAPAIPRAPSSGVDLELDLPLAPPSRPKAAGGPKSKPAEEELRIELAVDLSYRSPSPHPPPPATGLRRPSPIPPSLTSGVADRREIQALADYGDPPSSWMRAPFYAYRVFKRRRELTAALEGRREEAASARRTLEDALVAMTERARPLLESAPGYSREVASLVDAEELVRARDAAVADEHGAHAERLRAIDLRAATVEAELGRAREDEATVAAELERIKELLARAEAKAKRAEIEQRARSQGEPPA